MKINSIRLFFIVLFLTSAVLGSGPMLAATNENGAVDSVKGPQLLAPITVGAAWSATVVSPPAFYFDGVGTGDGPFDYANPVGTAVYVTVVFQQ